MKPADRVTVECHQCRGLKEVTVAAMAYNIAAAHSTATGHTRISITPYGVALGKEIRV